MKLKERNFYYDSCMIHALKVRFVACTLSKLSFIKYWMPQVNNTHSFMTRKSLFQLFKSKYKSCDKKSPFLCLPTIRSELFRCY